jgi:hypothetical protein
VVSTIGSSVVVRLMWRPRGADADDQRYQVLGIKNGKIREMEDCRSLGEATKLAKRFAARNAA